VDRHRFDADPYPYLDPAFHFDHFDADPNPDPTLSFTQGGKI
jgi:hypothetical protein